MEKKQESLRTGSEKAGTFKTWKGKTGIFKPGRKKAGVFKTWKGKSRNL
jgi:hypothetical protein